MISFDRNDTVMHPQHGLGCVGSIEEKEIGGISARYLVVEFEQVMLTLRIPTAKLATSGLRRPCSRETMQAAMDVLPETRVVAPGHWSKRLAGLEEKLNSGQPKLLAELVRDLGRREHGAAGAQLYREALRRLSEELALLEDMPVDGARDRIEAALAPDSRAATRPSGGRGRPAAA